MVADELRRAIVTGEFPSGYQVNPSEIAERYGTSPTPAREAIQLLATEGLLKSDAYRVARVSDMTAEQYEELYLMRRGLETLAARLGTERITEEGIAEMAARLEAMSEAALDDDIDTFYIHDIEFHRTHYGAAGRPSLLRRIMTLRAASERYSRMAYSMPHVSMDATVKTHRAMLDAVRAGDGEAAAAHLDEDLKATLEAFAERFGAGAG
jgi:GntR family transcriptional regulator, rspAB operon transcriptional repressor